MAAIDSTLHLREPTGSTCERPELSIAELFGARRKPPTEWGSPAEWVQTVLAPWLTSDEAAESRAATTVVVASAEGYREFAQESLALAEGSMAAAFEVWPQE
jgi:hypothetical protein